MRLYEGQSRHSYRAGLCTRQSSRSPKYCSLSLVFRSRLPTADKSTCTWSGEVYVRKAKSRDVGPVDSRSEHIGLIKPNVVVELIV